MIKWSAAIYEKLTKKPNSAISKDEFQAWATEVLWKNGLFSINALFDFLNKDPAELAPDEESAT